MSRDVATGAASALVSGIHGTEFGNKPAKVGKEIPEGQLCPQREKKRKDSTLMLVEADEIMGRQPDQT